MSGAAGGSDYAVWAEGLVKSFGGTRALDGVDLRLRRGTVLGLLGPNGAGKTTTVRILTTLLRPDAGRAWIAGHDLTTEPDAVRRAIGSSGQYAAVDDKLTGQENLYLVGRLHGLSRAHARARARELLERFRLDGAATRLAGTYSGGMRRRLDLAGALVSRPSLVVLDEPTTGLDPRSRLDTWGLVAELVDDGTAVLLTTQYLEEADRLASDVLVIDSGRVIASGTPDQLKSQVAGERLEVVVSDAAELGSAAQVLAAVGIAAPEVDGPALRLAVAVDTGPASVREALRILDGRGIQVEDVALRRPTLDDVFLALTGHAADRDAEVPNARVAAEVVGSAAQARRAVE